MSISPEDVARVARLARLKLTPEELKDTSEQLGRIFDTFKELDAVDTRSVSPMAHVHGLSDVVRADEPRVWEDRERLLENSPAREGSYFKVPKVLG